MPPLWGSINVFQCFTQGLRPGLCGSIALSGLFENWSNSLFIICRSNYCSVSLFAFVVGLVVRCGCLRLLLVCWVSLFALAVEFIVRSRCLRLLLDWLGGPLFAFIVGLVVRFRCLRLLSDLLGGAGVSAVGTTLLQSPGWRECQRHEQNPG